ncbi:MAG: tetratricopeptide repeat protein [Azoarcus sp.]|jgi:tetratricopeptide (TPR) repeat protein|nr:tetratricopeptide repeat protein [Azoarcus sp.]
MKPSFVRNLPLFFAVVLAFGLTPAPRALAADVPAAAPSSSADEGDEDSEDFDAEDDGDETTLSALTAGKAAKIDKPPVQQLTQEMLFNFLYAEIAGARGQPKVAAQTMLALARKTRDPRIARRAVQFAAASRESPLITDAAKLWFETAPNSSQARELVDNIAKGHDAVLGNAQAIIARALASRPEKLAGNLMGLNAALAKAEDKESVRKVVYQLTEPYLDKPEAHFARAQASAIAKRSMEAMAALDRALKLRPDWTVALIAKAQLLAEAGANAQADKLLEDALKRHPADRDLRLAYARGLIAQQRYEEARREFNTLLAAAPDDREFLYTVAMLSAELKDPATAEPLLKKALAAGHPQADAIRIQLGKLAEDRGQYAEARKWYDAVTPGTYSVEARIRSAQTLAKQGRLNEARALLQLGAKNADDEVRRRYLLADSQLLVEAKRVKEAFALVDGALAKTPEDTDLLYESAMLAERIGLHSTMEGRLRKLIALTPDFAHAYNALGYSLADRGERLDEAEKLIARALELQPKDPFILDSAGWVRFKRGDLPGALSRLEEAYAIRTDPEIAAHLGEVLWLLKRNDEARRILDAALVSHPDSDALKNTVQRLYAPSKKR